MVFGLTLGVTVGFGVAGGGRREAAVAGAAATRPKGARTVVPALVGFAGLLPLTAPDKWVVDVG